MLTWFQQLSVAARLRMLAFFSVFGLLAVSLGLMWTAYQQKLDDRRTAVQQTVEVAHAVVQWAHAQAEAGKLSPEAAQQQALSAIDRLRYGKTEYFWVNDLDGRMIHHPIKPQLNGQNVNEMKDPNGVYLFQRFNDVARQAGAGFVSYQWPKPGVEAPVDKVSYVKAFAPWRWVVGSGLYIDDLENAFRAQVIGSVAFTLLIALIVWGASEWTARELSRGVHEAVDRAEAIAQGDLGVSSEAHPLAQGDNEISRLLKAMDRMGQQLSLTLGQVRDSVDNVALASHQIAVGNQDLNHRTEQAASRLQHTASSMEQLSGTVTLNAQSSTSAQEMASDAANQARRGGEVVAQVVNTMEAIHGSARKITDIITVIDGIAFQTNILALNAAVEAARAGEQGRGFAVVAGEVRTLAQRSANAAREIKSLIQASTEHVESGAALVHDAGQTMQSIVASVDRVAGLIHGIAHATQEQSQGVGTIHSAVTQLDEMTQQNAALVEQSAAAAGSLKDQAESLARVVGRFKLAQVS
ncbi:MAG: cache domain-containing protein [Burkholderiales bacterium]|nr:cache domain-containing protein [Burkholderiales bacterium]MBH2015416.1 cache domain-containing protein [Burkholderiales bacterium]